MKIDCSKISNKGDLLALTAMLIIALAICAALILSFYVDTFIAGFFSATITWNWNRWIFRPVDNWLDKLWPQE